MRTDALPELVFDPRSQRWRYRDSKNFAPMDAVRSQAKRYSRQQQSALQQLGKNYSDGKLDLRQFQQQAGDILKTIHLASMVQALDKQSDLKPAHFLLVARNLKQEYYQGKDPITGDRFGLKHLAQDMASGKVSPAQLLNRLDMFGEGGKLTYWGTKKAIATDNGMTKARRKLGSGEHCRQCPSYVGEVAIADLILPTEQCDCRRRCNCSVEFL